MADFFPKGAVIRRVNAEPAVLFGAGRALLLQLAHPAVAQGVADHSDFQNDPFRRLQGTLEATYVAVFGPRDLAIGVGRRIQWIHDFVVGPTYRANDSANLLWVHATLMDTALRCYETLVQPLSPVDRETYYQEMTQVAELFGCPRSAQPDSLGDFESYFAKTVESIQVTDVGRRLAGDIVRPVLPAKMHFPLAPALAFHRLFAVGTTPGPLREQFGFAWDERAQRRFERAERAVRGILRATPRVVRTTPNALGRPSAVRAASKHVAQFEARRAARE